MGCDIHGQIEYCEDKRWYGLINIGNITFRAYTPWRMLFGVRNYNRQVLFPKPLFPDRGIPDGFNREFGAYRHGDHPIDEMDHHSQTYFNYTDIKGINWREKHIIKHVTTFYHEGKSQDSVTEDVVDYRVILHYSDWKLIFRIMRDMAKRYGDDNVRCVVWFDN